MELFTVVLYQTVFYLMIIMMIMKKHRVIAALLCGVLLFWLTACHPAEVQDDTVTTDTPTVTTETQEVTTAEPEPTPLTDEELTVLLTPKDGEVLLLGQILHFDQDRVSIDIQHAGGEPRLYSYSPTITPNNPETIIVQNRMITTQPEYNSTDRRHTYAAVLCTPDYTLDGCPIQPENIKVIVLLEAGDYTYSSILPYLPGQTYPTPVFPTEYESLAKKPGSKYRLGYVIEASDGGLLVAELPRLSVDLKTFGVQSASNQVSVSYNEETVCTENGEPFDPGTLALGHIIAFRSGKGSVRQESAPGRITGYLSEIIRLGVPID